MGTTAALDVIVIGGGPAGLAATLTLGRAGKHTLLVDDRRPRHAAADAIHGVVGLEGVAPDAFARRAREALATLSTVRVLDGRVASLERRATHVEASIGGEVVAARRALLATGLRDVLPSLDGLAERWGASVFACPHCHGHEHRGRAWGVLARSRAIAGWVPLCTAWSDDVTLYLDGRDDVDPASIRGLAARGVRIEPRRVVGLRGEGRALSSLALEGGVEARCEALVLHPGQRQVDLVLFAGLALDGTGALRVSATGETSMSGVFAVGDARGAPAKVLSAAADGAHVAASLADALTIEDFEARPTRSA